MAYVTKYKFIFKNEKQEIIEVLLQQRDGNAADIIQYSATDIKLSYNGSEGKYTTMLGLSLDVEFNLLPTDLDYWPNFAIADATSWKVLATNDGMPVFHGFILPDEGVVPFQDPPYNARITAVDGIGLLKDVELEQPNHTKHRGEYLLIWYLASALQQTGLALPIRIYDDVYHKSHLSRTDNLKYDLFGQTKLEYRTFLKDATTFVSAYEAIEIILKGNYRLNYFKGEWVIIRLSLLQYVPFVMYNTLYDYNGANPIGFEVSDNYATVGRNELIFPHSEDQNRYYKQAAVSVRSIWEYNVWPEIPKNNKFERGEAQTTGIAYDELDINGNGNTTEEIGTYTDYNIPDWEFGNIQIQNIDTTLHDMDFSLSPVSGQAFVRRTESPLNIEISREVVLPAAQTTSDRYWLRSEGIPVIEGDHIKVGFDYRLLTNRLDSEGGFIPAALVYIVPNSGGQGYALQGSATANNGVWQRSLFEFTGTGYLRADYSSSSDDPRKYHSYSVESQSIPVNGTLYLVLISQGISSFLGPRHYFRNVTLEYIPFVAGGYRQVKSEYFKISQNTPYPNKVEDTININCNAHKVFKGCLLDTNGVPLSDEWYRYGLSETRRFNYLTTLQRYNHEYRRFQFIEGSFSGLKQSSNNNQDNLQPIALHKQYRFVDIPGEDRRFMITSPLQIDMGKGWLSARFYEVLWADIRTQMQKESMSDLISRIIDTINNTTEEEWNSSGNAPAHGTRGFPPYAFRFNIFGSSPNAFMISIDDSHSITLIKPVSTNIEESDPIVTNGYKTMGYTIKDYKVGDILIFKIYGHSASITVQENQVTIAPDGQQIGDKVEFKYNF